MQNSLEVIEILRKELEKRKFSTGMLISNNGRGITALNHNFSKSEIRAEITTECETIVSIIIGNRNNALSKNQFNAAMKDCMQHFDSFNCKENIGNPGLVMKIHTDGGQSFLDIGEIASVITRAYSLAATTT